LLEEAGTERLGIGRVADGWQWGASAGNAADWRTRGGWRGKSHVVRIYSTQRPVSRMEG